MAASDSSNHTSYTASLVSAGQARMLGEYARSLWHYCVVTLQSTWPPAREAPTAVLLPAVLAQLALPGQQQHCIRLSLLFPPAVYVAPCTPAAHAHVAYHEMSRCSRWCIGLAHGGSTAAGCADAGAAIPHPTAAMGTHNHTAYTHM